MRGGDEDLAKDFRERACREANDLQGKRRKRLILSLMSSNLQSKKSLITFMVMFLTFYE